MDSALQGQAEVESAKPRKIWRWEVIAGLCLINGYRYGAELGVSQGRFTTFLCGTIPDMRMVAVDLWKAWPKRDEEGAETYEDWPHDETYEKFSAVCKHWYPQRVQIIRDYTVHAAQQIPDGALDFVFIDADHTYGGAKADILVWRHKIRKGGMISGHDYNWPSVKKAVDEEYPNAMKGHDNVWWSPV